MKVMLMKLLALTWNVKLKRGPITPRSSRDSSDLISYRVGFESLLKETISSTKQLSSVHLGFVAHVVKSSSIPASVSAAYFPTLILFSIFQMSLNYYFPVICTFKFTAYENHLNMHHLLGY